MTINIKSAACVASSVLLASVLSACATDQPPASALEEYSTQSPFPGAEWTRVDPATAGFSQEGIDQAVAYAKREGSTSGMIVQHGLVVAEWGTFPGSRIFIRRARVSRAP
ncbi:hypothetical protein [Paraburkholderia sp.]|uniref:hypothetical protein n=1 Tax=Paraburkholderia sp. TaxID=1926495 RepID=UPI002636D287|nr:hypothetical protein [Paraburkholderia sp.]